jgi:hypothetical protein
VFALRNLCEDNQANQDFIQSLQPQQVAEQPEELQQQGVNYKIVNGKLTPCVNDK